MMRCTLWFFHRSGGNIFPPFVRANYTHWYRRRSVGVTGAQTGLNRQAKASADTKPRVMMMGPRERRREEVESNRTHARPIRPLPAGKADSYTQRKLRAYFHYGNDASIAMKLWPNPSTHILKSMLIAFFSEVPIFQSRGQSYISEQLCIYDNMSPSLPHPLFHVCVSSLSFSSPAIWF